MNAPDAITLLALSVGFVLGLSGPVTAKEIDAAYRAAAATAHPDTGGSTEAMAALNRARAEAKAAVA